MEADDAKGCERSGAQECTIFNWETQHGWGVRDPSHLRKWDTVLEHPCG